MAKKRTQKRKVPKRKPKVQSQVKKGGQPLKTQNRLPVARGAKGFKALTVYTKKLQEIPIPKRKSSSKMNHAPRSPCVINPNVAKHFFVSKDVNVEATKNISTFKMPNAEQSESINKPKASSKIEAKIEKAAEHSFADESEFVKPEESSKIEVLPKPDSEKPTEFESTDMGSKEPGPTKTTRNVSPDLFSDDSFVDCMDGRDDFLEKCDAATNTVISAANIYADNPNFSGENQFLNRFADRLGVNRERVAKIVEDLRFEDGLYETFASDQSNDDGQSGDGDYYTDEIDAHIDGLLNAGVMNGDWDIEKIRFSSETSTETGPSVQGTPPRNQVFFNGRFHEPYRK